ncbi:D-xylose 1-dehydrogenase Gfo6 [Haladaptatus pallidirubidus]|uniref:D-xylose 1-dehydrogenase Gfo6 n=1 Tax=Haladaptatus pallidirubidus TaxID=1008152 RepID=UPI0026E54079|nr:D-xylose 1-dehydrogenase Gfo6 [Haladaptatus pallidirubidus]
MHSWIQEYTERDWQTTTNGTVRFALIGLGWWTVDVAIPAIESSTLCETTVLVSGSKEKAERIADEHDIEHGLTYDEYHDGAATEAYDAVYIGTPNAYHFEHVKSAARFDKAALCEKPLEATAERAQRLVEAAEDADIPLMTAYRMQVDPAVRCARELIEDGFIGEPTHVYGNNSQSILEMIPDPDQWRLDPDVTGYGTSVMDLGIYTINTARFLLRRDPVAATAYMTSEHDGFEAVPDERAAFTLTFEGGVPLVSTASQNTQGDTQLKITGTEGQIDLDPAFHGKVILSLNRDDIHIDIENTSYSGDDEMEAVFDYFADRVLSGEEIYPDGHHALVDMETIHAIHEAAETGSSVDI